MFTKMSAQFDGEKNRRGINVFVAGCIHGYWDELVDAVKKEMAKGNQIDVVLVNGDNHTFRNEEDMLSSKHYKNIKEQKPDKNGKPPKYTFEEFYGSFHKYINSSAKLPCLFILIGGNNECEDLLFQMPYGGFIAENIYYTGRSSILDYKGLRISALSGIFFDKWFNKPICEKFPIRSERDLQTSYYVRSSSVYQLLCYQNLPQSPKINVMMTHDWPIEFKENKEPKEIFKNIHIDWFDKYNMKYGNIYACDLLAALKPKYWTAAHNHAKFEADYVSGRNSTHFIASPRLCDNLSSFYRIIHFDYDELNPETRNSSTLTFAPEWIAILQSTQNHEQLIQDFKFAKWGRIQNSKLRNSILKNLETIKTKQKLNSTFLEVPYNIYDPCESTSKIRSKYQIQNQNKRRNQHRKHN